LEAKKQVGISLTIS